RALSSLLPRPSSARRTRSPRSPPLPAAIAYARRLCHRRRWMPTAELRVRCLENEGVDWAFGVPGEETLALLDALLDSDIHFLQTRHEQGAAFMADVQGRLSGKARVCLATLGPGATNLLTGVADASMDRAPLVAITAQAGTERFHKESHQYLDLLALFRPAVKWNAQLVRPAVVPEAVRKAFKVAQTEKPGATHLDLPEDVAEATAPSGLGPLLPQQPFPTEPLEQQIERAARIVSEARDPIILAGNGVARGRAHEALRHFAETLGIPVAETFMGKGSLPDRHPLCLGTVGLQQRDVIRSELEAESGSDAFPLKPQRVVRELRAALGDDDILVSDVGAHKLWIARLYPCAAPNTCVISNGFASMGIALPGAIGAKLLHPERRVLAASGDGGFLMNVQELETALRARTPVVTVVFEDGAYGVIKWNQLRRYGRPAFVDFGNPDFVALAEAFGCRGYRVTAAAELGPILEDAFRQAVPAVVACPVDYGENMRLTEKLGALVCPV